ncbi:MAG TPA: hypothetical protein VMN39_12120, partial [Longimicrobiaceae bacterium]|nr:hypothetical protein [Longimicrobiaceae bacterium]
QARIFGLPFDQGEVRERDYFFIVSFSLWGLWTGIGLTALWLESAAKFGRDSRALLKGSPVMAVALLPLVLNWSYASRAGDYSARDWAYNLLNSVEPYSVLITNGDNDTFPLWYLQEVEGIRQDVTVVVWSYLNTPWYARQIRDLTRPCNQPGQARTAPTRIVCQREFDPATAPPIYGDGTYPSDTVLPLSDQEIETVTRLGYVQLPQDVLFEAGGVRVPMAEGTILAAANQFILSMIRNSWGDRPIYFAMTTGTHHDLGLGPYVARQGLAFRLIRPETAEAEGLVPMPRDPNWSSLFGAYLDVDKTRQLLWEHFIYRGLPGAMDRWVDDSTRQIPTYYGYAHIALSQAEQEMGNEEDVERNLDRADEWIALSER